MVAIPRGRDELLGALAESYDRLAADLARVPASRAREASLPGHRAGARMSPADLVAYLVGWSELVLSWHADRRAGIEPDLPAQGYSWNELGELAQKFYADHAEDSWPDLLGGFAAAKDHIVALVDGLDDTELYGAPWYRTYTAGRMIQLNTVSPWRNARGRLRAWLRENDL
ncbi:ClbS/DfsB family four-helix bundle protein [Dietzia lutea]|nr:ClbS/DfsB family four-helix bundle protein [Dietzia lutea]